MNKVHQNRYLRPFLEADLKEKIVLLSGPRQVGKTTLALQLLGGDESHPAYFNWDYEEDQRKLLALEFPLNQKLLVLDEIHKYRRWRNWLKGLYDKTQSRRRYLVTGSARLDLYPAPQKAPSVKTGVNGNCFPEGFFPKATGVNPCLPAGRRGAGFTAGVGMP